MIFGGGYLVKKFHLSSKGFFINNFLFLLFAIIIFIVFCIFFSQIPIWAIILSIIILLFSILGIFSCLGFIKVNIKKNEIFILTYKIKKIKISDIKKIFVSVENSLDKKKYCNIIFLLNNNEKYFISGYLSYMSKNHDVEKTQKIVDQINLEINKI